jgi:hypothetical protein
VTCSARSSSRSTETRPATARRSASTVRELRLELAYARQQIGELERTNQHWRDVAAAERARAAALEDALRRSYRVALGIGGRRA